MAFESMRGYVELASGLSDLTRARALEAAQGLLSLPASSMATGTKMAVQATALADELLAAAAANRANLTALIRDEVDAAIIRVGLVPVQKLEESQAQAATLRAEVARLRAATPKADAPDSPEKGAAAPLKQTAAPVKKSAVRKTAAPVKKSAVKKTAAPVKKTSVKKTAAPAKKSAVKKTGVKRTTAKKASGQVKKASAPKAPGNALGVTSGARSAVTTHVKPAGT